VPKSSIGTRTPLFRKACRTGRIWKYTGTPCNGNSCPSWQMLDDNAAALSISAGGNSLYQLHNTGKVWKYVAAHRYPV
jgi:hypothetical protein